MIDDDVLSTEGKCDVTNIDELVKDYKRNRKRGMLGWFKLRVSSLFSLANDFNVNFDLFMVVVRKDEILDLIGASTSINLGYSFAPKS